VLAIARAESHALYAFFDRRPSHTCVLHANGKAILAFIPASDLIARIGGGDARVHAEHFDHPRRTHAR